MLQAYACFITADSRKARVVYRIYYFTDFSGIKFTCRPFQANSRT